jgi:hypothetical protein
MFFIITQIQASALTPTAASHVISDPAELFSQMRSFPSLLSLRQSLNDRDLTSIRYCESFQCEQCLTEKWYVEYSCGHKPCLRCFIKLNTNHITSIVTNKCQFPKPLKRDQDGHIVPACVICLSSGQRERIGVCSFFTYRLLAREAYEELKQIGLEHTREEDSRVQ